MAQESIKDVQNRHHGALAKLAQSTHKTVEFTEQVSAKAGKGEKDLSDLKFELGDNEESIQKLKNKLKQQQSSTKQLGVDASRSERRQMVPDIIVPLAVHYR